MTTASELSMGHGVSLWCSRLTTIIPHHYLSSRYYFWKSILIPQLAITPIYCTQNLAPTSSLLLIWLHLYTSMFYFKFHRNWITLEYLASIFVHRVHVSRTVRPIPIVRPIPVSYVTFCHKSRSRMAAVETPLLRFPSQAFTLVTNWVSWSTSIGQL